jgi:hypothetical protein
MIRIQRTLRVLLFVAASCLVLNDCVRLVFSFDQAYVAAQLRNYNQQEENNPVNAFSIFEEEVKHKDVSSAFSFVLIFSEEIETFVGHLIKDDEVRHLAYLAIFSPPPNLA